VLYHICCRDSVFEGVLHVVDLAVVYQWLSLVGQSSVSSLATAPSAKPVCLFHTPPTVSPANTFQLCKFHRL